MQNKPTPTEGQNSDKLEAESALRGAACCASSLPTTDDLIASGELDTEVLFDKVIRGRRVAMELVVEAGTRRPADLEGRVVREEQDPATNEFLGRVLLAHASPETLERNGLLQGRRTESQDDL